MIFDNRIGHFFHIFKKMISATGFQNLCNIPNVSNDYMSHRVNPKWGEIKKLFPVKKEA